MEFCDMSTMTESTYSMSLFVKILSIKAMSINARMNNLSCFETYFEMTYLLITLNFSLFFRFVQILFDCSIVDCNLKNSTSSGHNADLNMSFERLSYVSGISNLYPPSSINRLSTISAPLPIARRWSWRLLDLDSSL